MPPSENDIKPSSLPPVTALAYLGDAVHSLYVRKRLCLPGFVTAVCQAELYRNIEEDFSDWERDVFRRARNHKGLGHPKSATGADYRTATGFEAVLGALYVTEQTERLAFLLDKAHGDRFETLPNNP
ncbi:MAG: ribonuclease III [Clostridia bacterium]|nr:ribonuclease III [Clostridia bacterium]